MKSFFILIILIHLSVLMFSQQEINDTLKLTSDQILIKAQKDVLIPIQRLSDTYGSYITAGKKNEVIDLSTIHANIAEKTGRQIFAKVPGAFIYDMDGSGNQMNISTRGLDPHRSWEYNIRQNGIMTNTDIYGYPASHYNQPMESIRNIELIRGSAALQYGAQFGGLINYVTKKAPADQNIQFESISSIGSYGLLSTYNAIGGTIGKLSYYGYYHKRISEGYRQNSGSSANGQFLQLKYQFSENLSINAELGRSVYQYQLPGPLTDEMFESNPRQSTRTRNHYSPEIFVPSISFEWQINPSTNLLLSASGIRGDRNSVLFVGFANRSDMIDPVTGMFQNRQVDIDNYKSHYNEIRLKKSFKLLKKENILAAGMMYINNHTQRRQQGKGTTGMDYDLSIEGDFGRDLHFKTRNVAFFAENLIYLTSKWSITPGIRIESGNTNMSGFAKNIPENIKTNIKHQFPLLGISTQYKIDANNRFYAGYAQAYRPVIFADVIPADELNRTDPNLKNATGFNVDVGFSGKLKNKWYYDISFFALKYTNRIGNQQLIEDNQTFIYKTNTGSTITSGLEFYLEYIALRNEDSKISMFSSTSIFQGEYLRGNIVVNNSNTDITGNRPESLPQLITRNGISCQHKKVSGTFLYSYVSETFADPLNTVNSVPTGAVGTVPGYALLDFNATINFSNIFLKTGINNLLNRQYFTKRPTTYPGPGIWPSDGRSLVFTVGFKI